MSFDIYAYFNVEQLALLIDAITAFTASGDYLDLIKTVVMFGFIILIAGLALGKEQDPFEFFRWLMTVTIITTVLLIPKVDVVIVDRTGTSPAVAKANVPIGFAFFASVTSHVGDYLTRGFETIFALPTDLQFQKHGIMFGNTVLTESLKVGITDPALQKDMLSFINSCTYYDILANRIDPNTLSQSADIWAGLSDTSLTLRTAYSSDPTGSMACDDAYAALTTRLTAEVNKQSAVIGRKLNPKALNNAVAQTLFTSQISNSYTTLTTISKSATEILRQNMMANTFRSSQMASAQRLDDTASAVIGAAQAEAELSANTNYLVMARIAERAAPAIRNTVEIIIYAVFPIILVMLLVAPIQSGPILKNYVLTMLWVQIIPALYAVLNFVMVSASYVKLKGIVDGYSATNVTMQSIGDLSQQGLSDMAMAGYLTLLIPAIAYAVVKTGEIGGAALFTAAMSGASGAASSASSSLTKGNIDQGLVNVDNKNMNNENMNKSDVSSSQTSGFNRVTNAQGTATTSSDGRTFRYSANLSNLGADASFGQKVANSQREEASSLDSVANRASVASAQSTSAALSNATQLVRDYQSTHGNNVDWGSGKGADAARTVSKMAALEDRVAETLGTSFDKSLAKDIVAATTTNGGVGLDTTSLAKLPGVAGKLGGLVGIKAGVGANTTDQSTVHKQKQLAAALSLASSGMSNISADERKAAVENFKFSSAYQEGERNNNTSSRSFNANKTDADTFTQTAEESRTKSQSLTASAAVLNDSWTVLSANYGGYVADKMNKEGQLSTFNALYQSNPDAAAKMYAAHLVDLAPGLAPTKQPTGELKTLTEGTPLGRPLGSGTGPTPQNTTTRSAAANADYVSRQGWHGQTAAGSPLVEQVKREVAATEGNFSATRDRVESKNDESKGLVTSLTQQGATDLTPRKDGGNPTVDDAQETVRQRLKKPDARP